MNDLEAKKLLLTCPGDTIQETIDFIGMSQAELAERLGRSVPKLNELIKGKAPVTIETANKLEYVLGISANLMLNLERAYQDELFELEKLEYLEHCKEWVKAFPLSIMRKFNLLPDTADKSTLAESLLKFFRVASPTQWSNIYNGVSLAFKIELKHTVEAEAISVWLRLGELQAEKLQLSIFNKSLLRQKQTEIQRLVHESPKGWMNSLQDLCAECGIALVYTPCISKAPIYGATRWIKNNSIPLIQITDRRKDHHSFWFTFYHELGHVIYHGKKEIFIEGLDNIKPDKEKEDQADEYASRMILSEKVKNEIFSYPNFTRSLVIELSERLEVHPGIIVSQLQRKGLVRYNDVALTRLKAKVAFEESVVL